MHNEKGQEEDENNINGLFKRKPHLWEIDHFGREKHSWAKLWLGSKNFVLLLHNERDQEKHESYVEVFFKRVLVGVRMDKLL